MTSSGARTPEKYTAAPIPQSAQAVAKPARKRDTGALYHASIHGLTDPGDPGHSVP
jgi:hypothetical protein